jgi:hypothetical protein
MDGWMDGYDERDGLDRWAEWADARMACVFEGDLGTIQ